MIKRSEWISIVLVLGVACGNQGIEPQRQPPGDYEARRGADVARAKQLYRDGKKEEGAALLRELAADDNWNVRSDAVRAIGDVQDPALLSVLHARLDDERTEVRESVTRVLTFMGDASSREPLRDALSDPQGIVRSNAAEALIKIAGAEELAALGELLEKDDDPNVRAMVAMGLGEVEDPAVVPVLADALDDENPIVRGEIVQALGAVGHASARPALEKAAASDPDAGVRERAAAALQQLESSDAAEK